MCLSDYESVCACQLIELSFSDIERRQLISMCAQLSHFHLLLSMQQIASASSVIKIIITQTLFLLKITALWIINVVMFYVPSFYRSQDSGWSKHSCLIFLFSLVCRHRATCTALHLQPALALWQINLPSQAFIISWSNLKLKTSKGWKLCFCFVLKNI